jgi:hypothetical protein
MLEPEGYGTRLRLEDGPFPLDTRERFDAWEDALEAWVESLAGLRAFVDFSVDIRQRP